MNTVFGTQRCTQRYQGKKGCLCSLWHLSLDFFDLQLFGAQAVRLIPK